MENPNFNTGCVKVDLKELGCECVNSLGICMVQLGPFVNMVMNSQIP